MRPLTCPEDISVDGYFIRREWDFLEKYLLGAQPPQACKCPVTSLSRAYLSH